MFVLMSPTCLCNLFKCQVHFQKLKQTIITMETMHMLGRSNLAYVFAVLISKNTSTVMSILSSLSVDKISFVIVGYIAV